MRPAKLSILKVKDRDLWMISIPGKMTHDGRRKRKYFSSEDAAEREVCKLTKLRRAHGIKARWIDDELARQASSAQAILKPFGVTLVQAASHYAAYLDKAGRSVTFAQAWAEHVKHLEEDKRRPTYVSGVKRIGDRLLPILGKTKICDINTATMEQALRHAFPTPTAFNVAKRTASSAFSTAIIRGWCETNPLTKIRARTTASHDDEIEIMTPEQAREFLAACKDFSDYEGSAEEPWPQAYRVDCRDMVIPVAIALFAGVRPMELQRLTWENFRENWSVIFLQKSETKTRTKRSIDVMPNLAKWIDTVPVKKRQGKIVRCFGHKWSAVRKAAGITGQDITRHSFASYYAAAFGETQKLLESMGHTSFAMLKKHYRQHVEKSLALEYWKIVPKGAKAPKMIRGVDGGVPLTITGGKSRKTSKAKARFPA